MYLKLSISDPTLFCSSKFLGGTWGSIGSYRIMARIDSRSNGKGRDPSSIVSLWHNFNRDAVPTFVLGCICNVGGLIYS